MKSNIAMKKQTMWKRPRLLVDTGEDGYSIIWGKWNGGSEPSVGFRYNGENERYGYPVARQGSPIWMVIPTECAIGMLKQAKKDVDSKCLNHIEIKTCLEALEA